MSISIVWRGMTNGIFPLIASLSKVSSTSPFPDRNVFVALEPDESCETTLFL